MKNIDKICFELVSFIKFTNPTIKLFCASQLCKFARYFAHNKFAEEIRRKGPPLNNSQAKTA